MTYLVLRTSYGQSVRFSLYDQESPNTCREISRVLPLKVKFVQGRFAGEEIYSSEGPLLELPAENATINLKDGEIGFAPVGERNEVARNFAIVYGKARLSDWVNVFGIVTKEDALKLKKICEHVWTSGAQEFTLEIEKMAIRRV